MLSSISLLETGVCVIRGSSWPTFPIPSITVTDSVVYIGLVLAETKAVEFLLGEYTGCLGFDKNEIRLLSYFFACMTTMIEWIDSKLDVVYTL